MEDLVKLRDELISQFNLAELDGLLFDLRIGSDTIPGRQDGIQKYAQEIVAYFNRRNDIERLLEKCQHLRPNGEWHSGIEEKVIKWVRFCIDWGYTSERNAKVENTVFSCAFWPNSRGYAAITVHIKRLPSMAELSDIQRFVAISFFSSQAYSLANMHTTKVLVVFVVPEYLIEYYRGQSSRAVYLPPPFQKEHVAAVFISEERLARPDCGQLSAWVPSGDIYRWALRNPPPTLPHPSELDNAS